MTTYYHVAPNTYQEGETLYSFIELWNTTGEEPAYKWGPSEGGSPMDKDFYIDSMDANVVCLFETIDEARHFIAEHLPSGLILEVNIPAWADSEGIHMDKVEEGFPCVYHRIPATLGGDTIITILE